VGSAGVLLPLRNPLLVARSFRLLEALYPGRIDLGVAAGRPGPAIAAAFARWSPRDEPSYEERLAELVSQVTDRAAFIVSPAGVPPPDLWLMGSGSPATAALAGKQGAGFSLSLFLAASRGDARVIDGYQAAFRPTHFAPTARWSVAVAGVCADSELAARRILADHHRRFANNYILPQVVGDPGQCAQMLTELAGRYRTDEVVFIDVCSRWDDRRRCYELLAAAMGLPVRVTSRAPAEVAYQVVP
jgi:alkanesulfonate monooxygenase SsuD/methylene tetrahydromethanopterin reductase-like flavin-dependent oxidoreductase (luciferase family)